MRAKIALSFFGLFLILIVVLSGEMNPSTALLENGDIIRLLELFYP
jgi:hypothetical protein